jgi:hypothetical protein
LDHIVHINDGSVEAGPIVLRLLPGEETIFNLRVVNHGKPSNISLEASDPVFKAVRLRKADHYVVLEETIPIMARMPPDRKRLDGEILLTGGAGTRKVPISLLREAEDPGDDLEDPGLRGDEDDPMRDDDGDDAGENLEREDRQAEEEEVVDFEERSEASQPDREEEERDARPIRFTRQRDLERYRSYRSSSRPGSAEEGLDGLTESRGQERKAEGINRQGFGPDPGYGSSEYPPQEETVLETEDVEEGDPDRQDGILAAFGAAGALRIIPAVILLALIVALILTFVTESIPEFPGALASSILIVTLIIYGAATLLKA